jgi:hypothetical protein
MRLWSPWLRLWPLLRWFTNSPINTAKHATHTATANTPTANTPTANTPTTNMPTANMPTTNMPTVGAAVYAAISDSERGARLLEQLR